MRRALPLLVLAALVTTTNAQAPALDPNATVATVNGEAIKAGEYYHRLEWFVPNAQSAFGNLPAGFQVLRQMISERMILQLAKSKGVLPTAPEIDARLAEEYAANPGLKADLASSGRSEADVRAEIYGQEAQFKLATAGITITDQEVEKRYRDLPNEFTQPAKYKLGIIAVGDDVSQAKVDDALRAKRTFADVAREFSLDVRTRENGGEYGTIPDTELSDAVRTAVSATPVGSTTGWIKGAGNEARVKFLVEGVTPAKAIPLDATVRTRIRRQMMRERGAQKNHVVQDLNAATKTATVTIAQPEFQKLYSEVLEKIKQAQG